MAVPLTLSSVPAQTPYVQYISGASQTVFPYPFEITQDSDLVCLINGVAQPTDGGYTLSGQGATNGGNLTFTIGQTAGAIITLYRNISIARITQLAQNGTFFAANFNNEFNRIYLIMQQLQQSLLPGGVSSFALTVPNSNSPAPTTLLTPANYANKYLSFDSNGNPQPAVLTSLGTITTAILAPFVNLAPTAAETAASVSVINEAISPGNINRYGTNTVPGTTDMTTALQAAVNQQKHGGVAVYVPTGTYKITSTVSLFAGCKITGDGWAAQSGAFNPVSGSILNYAGSSGTIFLAMEGVSPANYAEDLTLRDFAIYNSGGNANCTGIQLFNAPWSNFDNLYIAGFTGTGQTGTSNGIGIEQEQNSWGCTFRNLKILNCTTCLSAHDAGEDSTYISCSFRSYNYSNGVAIYQGDQCQTNLYLGCDISENLFGVLMNQGDTNGNGTGTPFPMHGTFINCQFEDSVNAAVGIVTSNPNSANANYPSLIMTNCRYFNNGISFPANNGSTLVYAQACSQITIEAPQEAGYSYGAILGITQFGFSFSGTAKPGPVTFRNDTGYTYGTSRFKTGSVLGNTSVFPGDHPLTRLTSASLSYTAGNNTRIPFTTVVSDVPGWANSSDQGWIPLRNQTVRFRAQIAIASAPIGVYSFSLYKNSSQLALLQSVVVGTASQPLILSGEFYDVPNGTTDFYWVEINCNQNFTLDTTAGNTWAVAELSGT